VEVKLTQNSQIIEKFCEIERKYGKEIQVGNNIHIRDIEKFQEIRNQLKGK